MEGRAYSSWMLERIAIGDTVRLRFGVTTMGRHSSRNIRVLDAAFVSRHHAIINVSDNDENVSIQDVSCNGIYVNERRYDKTIVQLKNNDLIGIGVSPTDISEDVDVLKLPIYQLKYAPIRRLQVPNATKAPSAPTLNDKSTKNEVDPEPCGSKSIKAEKITSNNEIFEISDDDECGEMKKPKINQMDVITQETHNKPETISNENQYKSIKDLNKHIEFLIKNEPLGDKDYLNPSQKSQETKSSAANLKLEKDKDVDFAVKPLEKSPNDNSNTTDVSEENVQSLNQTTTSLNSLASGEVKEPSMHVPIISNIKKEQLRSVSANIQNIFGDIDGDLEMQKTLKEINPFVYNEIHASKKFKAQGKSLKNGDLIVLTDDEELEDVEVEELGTIISKIGPEGTKSNIVGDSEKEMELKKVCTNILNSTKIKEKESDAMEVSKSPNIFDSSLDNSKEEVKSIEGNQSIEVQKAPENTTNTDNIDLDEYTKYTPKSDDEDIEDLMFSQVLINDMKAELQDDLNKQENIKLPSTDIDNRVNPVVAKIASDVTIKQEPCSEIFSQIPKELENSCWIISDEEDYDEELEANWSNRIFSQSFNLLSQNLSQVYDLEEPDKNDDDEENDCFEEDNLSILEDDIDGLANIYHSLEDNDVDQKLKSPPDEIKCAVEQTFDLLNNKSTKKNVIKADNIEDSDNQPVTTEIKRVENKEINQRIESPVIDDISNDTQFPIIRIRRISRTNPVIQSSSSSKDELDIKNKKLSHDLITPDADKILAKTLPPLIEAPSLPKHKGKLRGVSAELPKKTKANLKPAFVNKTINSIKAKINQESYTADLKRKWLEKPSIAKKRDKERKKFINECRKDKLKELAERKKCTSKENIKRKLSTDGTENKAKVAKVKVTTHNRGAFLANKDTTSLPPPPVVNGQKTEQINQFKIPKIIKKPDELKTHNAAENKINDIPPARSLSADCFETFSQQISKPDILLIKRQKSETKNCDKSISMNKSQNPARIRRDSITETFKRPTQSNLDLKTTSSPHPGAICKDAIAARAVRTTNKLTFASMEKNIVESEENKRKLSELCTKNTAQQKLKKKTVRFNDTPIIHYIERVIGACKKINYKDVLPLTSYKERRHLIRTAYPIIDDTDTIISNILCWSNEWLIKRNAAVDAAVDIIYPMPTHFNSFEHYKSIIFPLMKLEFVSTLEREYNTTQNVKNFKVSLEYAVHNKDRIMLVTKSLNCHNKELSDCSLSDLVLLEPDKRGPQIFAFVVANRKGAGIFATIVYEIVANNFTIEYFKAIKELNVRHVMDKVRVHFGAFNSVYQLQSTPLFQTILNPLEYLKCRPPPKKKVIYRGFDKLNDKQRQVLLNTYIKIIDESTPNISLIQGPPGTGKSCVITNLVLQTLYGEDVRYLDKKILICAPSNAAVDVIAGKLYNISMRMRPEKRFRLIRYGLLNKIHPDVTPVAIQKVVEHDQLKKLQAKNKSIQLENKDNLKNQILQFEAQVAEMSSRNIKGTVEEDVLLEKKRQLQLMRNILNENMRPEDERSLFSWYLCNANIVCATLTSCVNLSQYIDYFDICIIDEATQCTEPWTLLPLKFGINSLVLVGDTQQLPATVISKKANELGLGTSMFKRIQQCLDSIPCSSIKGSKAVVTAPNNIICSLQTQYRMHPEICRWPNQYFYRNELISDKSTIDLNKSPLVPFSILNLTYTQSNSGINGKITNNLEAEFVAKLLKALDGFVPNKYNSYGVITPYAHHRATLESSIRNLGLTNIMVNTIDSYQGLEKNVIVISNARTNGVGFLSNPQRLNVALTRSKKCLILCGNFKNLESVPAWRCLLENARARKLYHEISANCMDDIQTNVIDKIKLRNQNQQIFS